MTEADRTRTQKIIVHFLVCRIHKIVVLGYLALNIYICLLRWELGAFLLYPGHHGNVRNQASCLPLKKFFQIVFLHKKLLQLPSATQPNAWKTPLMDKLYIRPGCLDQFYNQDRMKTAVHHTQRENPSHTEPPLRLLSVNNTNSFLSSFPVDFCFQIPPHSAVPLQQALPPPLIQLPSSNSPLALYLRYSLRNYLL